MYDVILGEVDVGIPVRMGIIHMHYVHGTRLVKMQGELIRKGDFGKGCQRGGRAHISIALGRASHPVPDRFVCDQDGTPIGKIFIPSGMVPMPVGVYKELQGFVRDFPYGGHYFIGQGCVLVIDEIGGIIPDGQANVATGPEQDIDLVGYFFGPDFYIVKVALGTSYA